MRHSIFLSYRRADTSGHAGRLTDDLERRFGPDVVFRDIESIDAGRDFVDALDRALSEAQVVLVLIGDTWLTETDAEDVRRLEKVEDYVRNEVATALLRNDLVVVPVLVEGASMPAAQELPESLQPLTRLQAIELSEGRWSYDLDRLARVLGQAGIKPLKSRRRFYKFCTATLGAMLLIAGSLTWFRSLPPVAVDNYTGLWHLPDGSYWTVSAKDDLLLVEETNKDSQQVWKRGEGRTTGEGIQVDLSLVFSNRPYLYRHRLSLSSDGKTLIGMVTELSSGQEKSLVLRRD